jgi:hypothetical protein
MKAKDKVRNLLINNKRLRDSDNKLIATFWFQELKMRGIDTNEITGFELLQLFAESKLTNAETIRRIRAKLQETNKELRGSKYNLRQGKLKDDWRKELGYA